MEYRAKRAIHVGHGQFVKAGDVLPKKCTDTQLKHWLRKGYIEDAATKPVDIKRVAPPVETSKVTTDTAIADLPYIKSDMLQALIEVGLETVGDLSGWSKDDLVDLDKVGAATTDKLLATYASLME